MLIVPEADALTVEAKIAPQDIDQVRVGQQAVLRFSAFNQRTTPEINGEVSRGLGRSSARTRRRAPASTRSASALPRRARAARRLKLVPGMPVESFIQTGERTVISYLTKPLADQIAMAWRER